MHSNVVSSSSRAPAHAPCPRPRPRVAQPSARPALPARSHQQRLHVAARSSSEPTGALWSRGHWLWTWGPTYTYGQLGSVRARGGAQTTPTIPKLPLSAANLHTVWLCTNHMFALPSAARYLHVNATGRRTRTHTNPRARHNHPLGWHRRTRARLCMRTCTHTSTSASTSTNKHTEAHRNAHNVHCHNPELTLLVMNITWRGASAPLPQGPNAPLPRGANAPLRRALMPTSEGP